MTYHEEDRESASHEGNIITVVRDSQIEDEDGAGSSHIEEDNPLDVKFVKADVAIKPS